MGRVSAKIAFYFELETTWYSLTPFLQSSPAISETYHMRMKHVGTLFYVRFRSKVQYFCFTHTIATNTALYAG